MWGREAGGCRCTCSIYARAVEKGRIGCDQAGWRESDRLTIMSVSIGMLNATRVYPQSGTVCYVRRASLRIALCRARATCGEAR
ncbi:MAG: hypothetical protein HY667_04340 [Chloroflexi bacterium]|nr:hypothetical protein [Chloroflexota bacterium]